MILAVDVHYEETTGYCGGVLFDNWTDSTPISKLVVRHPDVLNYIPGQFYKRELPCILSLIAKLDIMPSSIIVDGYVFLDGHTKAGLGKYLYDSMNLGIPVIGVAKSAFTGISSDFAVYRGQSSNPLFVTSVGFDVKDAMRNVIKMDGNHRIPTLLKLVDQVARSVKL